MVVKFIALVVIILIIIFLYFHFKKFSKKSLNYEINQQEMNSVNGYDLYTITNPLIISFIEEMSLEHNVLKYTLYSPLSITKNFLNLISFTDSYLSHCNEILLIRPLEDIKITLINPKYKTHFNKNKVLNGGLIEYTPTETINQTQSVDIIVREYTILTIPRFWFFTYDKPNVDIEIMTSQNIFTMLFSLMK